MDRTSLKKLNSKVLTGVGLLHLKNWINNRINENSEQLYQGISHDFATSNHNHDDDYADKNHSHTGYATSNHNHDDDYADKNHSHTGYAASDHNHDDDYADKNHSHTGYATSDHNHDDDYADKNHNHGIESFELSGLGGTMELVKKQSPTYSICNATGKVDIIINPSMAKTNLWHRILVYNTMTESTSLNIRTGTSNEAGTRIVEHQIGAGKAVEVLAINIGLQLIVSIDGNVYSLGYSLEG